MNRIEPGTSFPLFKTPRTTIEYLVFSRRLVNSQGSIRMGAESNWVFFTLITNLDVQFTYEQLMNLRYQNEQAPPYTTPEVFRKRTHLLQGKLMELHSELTNSIQSVNSRTVKFQAHESVREALQKAIEPFRPQR